MLPLSALVLQAEMAVAAARSMLDQKSLSLELANALAAATLKACHETGRRAVVAVLDRGGNLVALQRDDNVDPHNTIAE